MIVVDTSALIAILLDEGEAPACIEALSGSTATLISAATMAEALVVARMRAAGEAMERLLSGLGADVVPVTEAMARSVADSYARWGKGAHPAGLNFGDCFAYALAVERGCPLLYVGEDFRQTDVVSALQS